MPNAFSNLRSNQRILRGQITSLPFPVDHSESGKRPAVPVIPLHEGKILINAVGSSGYAAPEYILQPLVMQDNHSGINPAQFVNVLVILSIIPI